MRFEIPGRPVPKGRPLFDGKRARTPERTRVYEELVAWHARTQNRAYYDVPVKVGIELYSDLAVVELEDLAPRSRSGLTGDIDNYAKAILDGLVIGQLLKDDTQVYDLRVRFGFEAGQETCG